MPDRVISPTRVTVTSDSGGLHTFRVVRDVWGPPTETIILRATWTVRAQVEGRYNVSVLATSNHPEIDPNQASVGDWCEVQVVRGAPSIGELTVSPVYFLPGLGPDDLYVYPGQDVEVRCNVTCQAGIENVTLHYSINSSGAWNQVKMSNESEKEFVASISGQVEDNVLLFYVRALSSVGKSARTKEYACTVADLQVLEFRVRMTIASTVGIILAGCFAFFAFRKRRLAEGF